MFYTVPEAEEILPMPILTPGEKCWKWVELPIHVPYYILSHVVESEGVDVRVEYLFAQVREIAELLEDMRGAIHGLKVGMFIPSYMNGTDGFQFGYLREIWRYENGTRVYHMDDGKIFSDRPVDPSNSMSKKLLFAV
jgi:hypothetical protein